MAGSRSFDARALVIIAGGLVGGLLGHTYAASTPVVPTVTAQGANAVASLVVERVSYQLDTLDPARITAVHLHFASPPTALAIQLRPDGPMYGCQPREHGVITCATDSPPATVAETTSLLVTLRS